MQSYRSNGTQRKISAYSQNRLPLQARNSVFCGAGTSGMQKIKNITDRDWVVQEYEEIQKSDRMNSVGHAAYVDRKG